MRYLCDPVSGRWVFKATVYKSPGSRGFSGYGDADRFNVSPLVHGAEMRVAETRAVNRALRKAYGIGLCSVEELGWEPKAYGPSEPQRASEAGNNNGHQNGQPRLRDRLCLLIRQHQLDAHLVKAYAADFCGTPNLRDASREQIEGFITNLADWATKDRPALSLQAQQLCRTARGQLMTRHIPGLHRETRNGSDELEGVFLVRVDRAFYRWHPTRPFYLLRFSILEPKQHHGHSLTGRIYCTPKALCRLSWFLRDFGYNTDLLGRGELDEKALLGLQGIVRVSHTVLNGHSFLNFDGFAPAAEWEEFAPATSQESSHDL